MADRNDDLLAGFDDDDEEEGEKPDSNPLRDARSQIRKLQKALKEANTKLEEHVDWRKAREEVDRKQSLGAILKQVGLRESHGELFVSLNPDVDPTLEAVKTFAEKYNLPTEEQSEEKEGESEEKPTQGSEGFFTPTSSLTTPSLPSKKVWEPAEFQKLYEERPGDALQIMREGRVKWLSTPAEAADVGKENKQ